MKLTTMLKQVGACPEAVEWANPYATLQAAWDACERPDWMLWLCGATNTHRDECIRLALRFADRAVRVDAVAALRSAADAKDMPPEHAKSLREHADELAALLEIDSRAAAWAASAAVVEASRTVGWAARDTTGTASRGAVVARNAIWVVCDVSGAAACGSAWAAIAGAGAASHAENARLIREAIPNVALIEKELASK